MIPGLLRRGLPLTAAIALVLATASAIPLVAQRLSFAFDDDSVGASPDGFFFATQRQAAPGTWHILGNGPVRHLGHVADPSITLRGMSLAGPIFDVPQNLKVSVRLRLLEGDRAGGVIWRYRDANNFYFLSLFLADHSASLVRVTEGNRVRLDFVNDVNLDPDAWHSMSISHDGDEIRGAIDGIGIVRARDRTPWDGNRAGIWSAGNTTGLFDDLIIESPE